MTTFLLSHQIKHSLIPKNQHPLSIGRSPIPESTRGQAPDNTIRGQFPLCFLNTTHINFLHLKERVDKSPFFQVISPHHHNPRNNFKNYKQLMCRPLLLALISPLLNFSLSWIFHSNFPSNPPPTFLSLASPAPIPSSRSIPKFPPPKSAPQSQLSTLSGKEDFSPLLRCWTPLGQSSIEDSKAFKSLIWADSTEGGPFVRSPYGLRSSLPSLKIREGLTAS